MTRNRDLGAALMVVVVAFVFVGFANGYFAKLPTEVGYRELAFVIPVLVLLPFIRSSVRWTALATGIIGVFGAVLALYNLATFPRDMVAPPAIGLLLVLGFTFLAFRAYLSEGRSQGRGAL